MDKSLEEQMIMNHVSEMENEIADWKTTYYETKSKLQELRKYENNVNLVDWEQCKNDLLEEDIQFLNASPDFKALISTLNDLTNKVEIVKKHLVVLNAKVSRNVYVIKRALQYTKQNICNYLLTVDESECIFNSCEQMDLSHQVPIVNF